MVDCLANTQKWLNDYSGEQKGIVSVNYELFEDVPQVASLDAKWMTASFDVSNLLQVHHLVLPKTQTRVKIVREEKVAAEEMTVNMTHAPEFVVAHSEEPMSTSLNSIRAMIPARIVTIVRMVMVPSHLRWPRTFSLFPFALVPVRPFRLSKALRMGRLMAMTMA